MKRIISLITAAALALGTTTAFAQDNGMPPGTETVTVTVEPKNSRGDEYSDGILDYLELSDGTYIVYNVNETVTEVTIPAKVNGRAVTSIGEKAFFCRSGLTSVTIPDSVTSIGDSAFDGCSALTSVTIPDSVTSIGDGAFGGCSALTSVTIPDSVTSIGDYAFYDCDGLTSVTIPDSVTSIGVQAFANCSGLTSVTIPDSVTSIGVRTFYLCEKLTSVTIPDSVTSIGGFAFANCSGLTSILIPNSVISIGHSAFYGCKGLTSVTIPDSVTSIGEQAFYGCHGLTSVTVPDSVISIGDYAFRSCIGLSEIYVDADNNAYCSVNGILFNKSKTFLIQCPAGIKKTSCVIPDSVTNIGDDAFIGCKGLTSVTIPDSVTSIGEQAFYGCHGLTSITVPDSVTSIGRGAFGSCSGVSALDVDIDNSAYRSIDGVLFDKSKTFLVQYPAGNKRASYVIPNSVTSIGDYAFVYCRGLTSISIPNSVTNIGYRAFVGCSGLTSVIISDSVTSIGDGAFYDCSELKSVYYTGTEEQWKKIKIGLNNWDLINATIHFNSTGPTGTPVEVTVKAPEGVNISGQTATTTVNGETKPLTITDGLLDLSGLTDGTYTFTFSANNCVPRDYKVTVSGGTAVGLEEGVELHLYGDINGDGKINTTDILKAKLQTKGSNKLDGYDLTVADANKDGKVNGTDVLKLKLHAKGSTKLW